MLPNRKSLISSSIISKTIALKSKQSPPIEKNNEITSSLSASNLAPNTTQPTNIKPVIKRKSMAPMMVAKNRFPLRKSIIPSKLYVTPAASVASSSTTTTTKSRLTIFKPSSATSSNDAEPEKPKVFNCDVCKKQFRLESLLVYHKKSHEKPENQCKYCDRKFELEWALKNHMIENCAKIPLSDKNRMLADTTLVKKSSGSSTSVCSSTDSSISVDVISAMIGSRSMRNLHTGVYSVPKKILKCEKCDKMFFTIHNLQDHNKEKKCRPVQRL